MEIMLHIIPRREAARIGMKIYFTGCPCKCGHIAFRRTSSGLCVECKKIFDGIYRKTDSAKLKAAARARMAVAKDPERHKEYRKRYHENNPDVRRMAQKRYSESDHGRERIRATKKNAMSSNPLALVAHRVRRLLGHAFSRAGYSKSSSTATILGCSWPELAAHIERQFVAGMGWHNRKLWHVDHIVPLATAHTEADILALSHFTNLRPLWSAENQSKSSKVLFLL